MKAFLTFTTLLLPSLAMPCSKSYEQPPDVELAQAYDQSDAVFAAKVLDRVPVDGFLRPTFRSALYVEHVWKSDGLSLASVLSGQGGGDCSLRLNAGASYVIFAKRLSDPSLELRLDSVEPAVIPPIPASDEPTEASALRVERYKLVLSIVEQKSK